MAKYPNSRGRFQNRNRGPKGLRRNDRIRASEVRVIGPEGTNLGVMNSKKALDLARNVGLDLIEISPAARPPVCRILDFGKFLYEESKKQKDTKQHTTKMKEVKFRVRIDHHDFETKLRRAEGFLFNGNKVGIDRINSARDELLGVGSADTDARLVGRQVTMVLSPLPESKRSLKFNQSKEDNDDTDDFESEENAESGIKDSDVSDS